MTARGSGFWEFRHEFYGGFTREHEPVAWGFIERNYLRKYRSFTRVDFDYGADGLWEIPFSGSVSMGVSVEPEYFGMPEPLAARILAWQAALDRLEPGEENLNHEASNAEGLEIAKGVKLFLGENYYVEFRPFREILVRDGNAVELEVPAFIADLTR